jgi:hypothetical protein
MKKHVFLAGLAWLLTAGCSGVKLNDVPVEDRTAGRGPAGGDTPGRPAAGPHPCTIDPTRNKAGPGQRGRIMYFDYDS